MAEPTKTDKKQTDPELTGEELEAIAGGTAFMAAPTRGAVSPGPCLPPDPCSPALGLAPPDPCVQPGAIAQKLGGSRPG